MRESKKRVPLNEEKLDSVSGGADTAEIGLALKVPISTLPKWAQGVAAALLKCRSCGSDGVITDFSYTKENGCYEFSIGFICPKGHTWDYSGKEPAYDG